MFVLSKGLVGWMCLASLTGGGTRVRVNECETKECIEIRSLASGKAEKEGSAKKKPCWREE